MKTLPAGLPAEGKAGWNVGQLQRII